MLTYRLPIALTHSPTPRALSLTLSHAPSSLTPPPSSLLPPQAAEGVGDAPGGGRGKGGKSSKADEAAAAAQATNVRTKLDGSTQRGATRVQV